MKNVNSRRKNCWPLFIFLAVVCTFIPVGTFGQSSNRWLFIFETTSSMRHRTNGVMEETQDLLKSGMHGLIHPGDTIGIWTFNDRLHTGEAHLQTWSPELSPKISRLTLEFLSEQQYAKSPNMNDMLTNMLNIVDSSPFITVILFTDGNDPIKGTPFDAQINEVYKAGYRQQKKASMPIVTVLRGVAGEITTNTVTMAPWAPDIPSVPPPPPPVRAKPHPAAPKPPPPPAVPPLIYHGEKPESAQPTPQPDGGNNATPVPPSNTESNSVAPKAEAPSAPSASVQSESSVVSAAAPAVEPMSSKPIAPAEAQPTVGAVANQYSEPVTSPSGPANEPVTTPKSSNPQSASHADVATAASAPTEELFSTRNIAIVSVVFAVLVCGLLVMAARRARASQASLITRSLERERR